jgi:hypothetical protein
MAEVEIGRGGVKARFDAEGAIELEPFAEVFFADEFGQALPDVGELFVDGMWHL